MSALFCKVTSKHDGDFYCLNCLHSFRTENKLKEHENVCKNHDYCYIDFYVEKSMKIPFIIYYLLFLSTGDHDKKYYKVTDHYTVKYRGAAHNACNLRYKTPKEILVAFHNGSKYDYHFIIKELAEKFEGQFECLGENTEKYITFSVPIKKSLKIIRQSHTK